MVAVIKGQFRGLINVGVLVVRMEKALPVLLFLLRCLVSVYTVLTWPIYVLVGRPWRVRARQQKIKVGRS